MRAFVAAGLAATVIAIGAAAALEYFVQESSATAFTEPTARISDNTSSNDAA
jgi:hypothetical protein